MAEKLTKEICDEYQKRAKQIIGDDISDMGPLRNLRIELQTRCGITEIQALNILRGYHIKDYLQFYSKEENSKTKDATNSELNKEFLEWLAKKDTQLTIDEFNFEEKD